MQKKNNNNQLSLFLEEPDNSEKGKMYSNILSEYPTILDISFGNKKAISRKKKQQYFKLKKQQ